MTLLRRYQEKGITDIRALYARGRRKICYAAPTGSGKTILFVHLARRIVEKGQRVTIVVHRQELIDQTCDALIAEGLDHSVIAAGYPENSDASVLVCMAQTVVNRLERLSGIQVLIVDEAHHVMAATWLTILSALPRAWVLGATATPERLDGKGPAAVFDALLIGPTVKDLTPARRLSAFILFSAEHPVHL